MFNLADQEYGTERYRERVRRAESRLRLRNAPKKRTHWWEKVFVKTNWQFGILRELCGLFLKKASYS